MPVKLNVNGQSVIIDASDLNGDIYVSADYWATLIADQTQRTDE